MKDFKIYLSVASVLMVIYLVAQYNKPTPVNWTPTLYYNDKIPYGTYVIYRQLGVLNPGASIVNTNASIYNTFHSAAIKPGNYIIIAKSVEINKFDFNELVKYIQKGNTVFIASFSFGGFLADTLDLLPGYENSKVNAELNFTNSRLKCPVSYFFKRDISNRYFGSFDTSKATVIGKNSYNHSNYLSFTFGKGHLLLCINPCLFSNYSLLTKNGAEYAAKSLSCLPEAKNIYWDEFQNGDIPGDESPLRVFFNNPSLQWAYYLSLFGLLIFVLFEVKRRQRIIPVVEPLTNSTLDFVNVVGQVYYEKRNNANMAHKKILYFFARLRDEYQIKTNNLDSEFVEKLTARLGIERSLVQELVSFIQYINVQDRITDHELIELNRLIEKICTQAG